MKIPEEYQTKYYVARLNRVWQRILSGALRSTSTAVWFVNHTELTKEEWDKVAPLLPNSPSYQEDGYV